jgi:hypothetical protein
MYTSEIRETDHEGKPVAVSPALLARVRESDEDLRERVGTDPTLDYTGRWVFPEPEKALLSLTLRAPLVPDAFTVSLPFNPRNPEWFSHQAVQCVLSQAGDTIQARIDRRLRDLRDSTPEGE